MGLLGNIFSRKGAKEAVEKPAPRQAKLKGDAHILTFSLTGKKPLEKVRFCQALFGRKEGAGMLNKAGGKKLGAGCILVPSDRISAIEMFMKGHSVSVQKQKIILVD